MSRNYFAFPHSYIWTNAFLLQPCIAIRHRPPRTTGKTRPNVWTSISQKEVNIPDSLFLATSLEPTAREVSSLLAMHTEDLLGAPLTPTVHTPQAVFTLADLPISWTRNAPKKFKGHYSQVRPFLRHYERICDKCQIISDRDKCDNVLQYCSRSVRECIKGLEEFGNGDWNDLKEQIENIFDAERDDQQYSEKILDKFCSKWFGKHIRSLSSWKKYYRGFYTIAGPLRTSDRITERQMAIFFWQGLRKSLRRRIEDRILASREEYDLETPFRIKDIKAVAEVLFHRNRFDANLRHGHSSNGRYDDSSDEDDNALDSDEEDSSDSSDWSEDEESSDSDSDSWSAFKRKKNGKSSLKKKNRTGKKPNKEKRFQKSVSKKDGEQKQQPTQPPVSQSKEKAKTKQQDEIEMLIKQLNSMSLNDPSYGLIYYKAIKMDPDVAKVVRMPITRPAPSGTSGSILRPPTLSIPNSDRKDSLICYGCGKPGHGISNCQVITDFVEKGIIQRDKLGRLVMKNGMRILRLNGEPFSVAIERQISAQANFISIETPITTRSDISRNDSDIQEYVF